MFDQLGGGPRRRGAHNPVISLCGYRDHAYSGCGIFARWLPAAIEGSNRDRGRHKQHLIGSDRSDAIGDSIVLHYHLATTCSTGRLGHKVSIGLEQRR